MRWKCRENVVSHRSTWKERHIKANEHRREVRYNLSNGEELSSSSSKDESKFLPEILYRETERGGLRDWSVPNAKVNIPGKLTSVY